MGEQGVRAVAGTVRGRVQGVGFRWFVRERARAFGLAGWVQNLPDGTVAFAAAGPADRVERLLEALRAGPPAAQVTDVEVRDLPADDVTDHPFVIRKP